MKHQYIEQRFPKYFVFGEYPETGNVDISDGTVDVAVNVTKETAAKIIAERDKIVSFITAMANAFDAADAKAFDDFWYSENSSPE